MHPILLFFFRLLIFYTGLTSALFSLSNFGFAPSSFYARCLTSYAALLLASSYGVLVSVLLRLGGYHRLAQYLVARCFKYAMWIATGVRFEIVEGKQYLSTKPCVIISNHQSELDVLLLGTVFPPYCSVTAKSSLRKVPFLGWFMALSGTVFIDRADKAGAIKAFEGAAEEMNRNKQSVFIFPEGTRSYARGPELGVFKKGAFHLAVRAGVDIVPVVCGNYSGILDIEHRRFRSGRIPVKILPSIPTKTLTAADVEELTRSTREKMLAELISLTESPVGQKAAKPLPSGGEEEQEARRVTGVKVRQ